MNSRDHATLRLSSRTGVVGFVHHYQGTARLLSCHGTMNASNSILSSSTEICCVGLPRHAAQASVHGHWWNPSFRPARPWVTDWHLSPCVSSHQNGAPDQASTERSGRIAPHGSIHPFG